MHAMEIGGDREAASGEEGAGKSWFARAFQQGIGEEPADDARCSADEEGEHVEPFFDCWAGVMCAGQVGLHPAHKERPAERSAHVG